MKLKNLGILIFLTYFLFIIQQSYHLYIYYNGNTFFLSRDLFIELCILVSSALMLVFGHMLSKSSEDDILFCTDLDSKSKDIKILFSLLKYSALLSLAPVFFYFTDGYLHINIILYNLFNIGLFLFGEMTLKLKIKELKMASFIFLFIFPIINIIGVLFNLANLFNYLPAKQLLFFMLPMLRFIPFIILSLSFISSIKKYEEIFIGKNHVEENDLEEENFQEEYEDDLEEEYEESEEKYDFEK